MTSQAIRRSDNASQQLPRLRDWLSWLLFGIVLACSFYSLKIWLYNPQKWPLSEWQLAGELRHTQQDSIRQILQSLQPFDSFMAQDLQVIKLRMEQLPWIAQAQVRKQWPNQLLVHFTEHQAMARWQQQLLNQYGHRFSAPLSPKIAEQLPQLTGPEGSEQQLLAIWSQLESQLSPYGLSVTAMKQNRRQAWELMVNRSMHCRIGKQDLQTTMQRLLLLYPLLMQHRPSLAAATALYPVVDLRYQQGVAIRWETKQPNDWNET